MSILGSLIQKSAKLSSFAGQYRPAPVTQQGLQLHYLLRKARNTAFGRFHGFQEILASPDSVSAFQRQVPATDYNNLYARWWSRAHLSDTPDVCWPGLMPYYALSSGTSQASTKYIPVSNAMLGSMRRGSLRLFSNVARQVLPSSQLTKQMLMVGSCTMPKSEGRHLSGDLSGIIGLNRPIWMERYYRPGRHITDLPEWEQRIEKIIQNAPQWDIGFAVSNPMWLQLILEGIIERYDLNHIHEMWPNFSVFVHGGLFFEPYRASFEKLLGKEIRTVDSYMASEGFFAYQTRPDVKAMQLITDGGIFYEFVPFNSNNFDGNGDLRSTQPEAYTLSEVEEGVSYALLLSTNAGAWRYLLGDTVQFTNLSRNEFKIAGRTKQYLSVCGEHLSIDNLNDAVRAADKKLNAGIREFCVSGVRKGSFWAHQWYVSCDNQSVNEQELARLIDQELCRLNDDYAVERRLVLQEVQVKIIRNELFMSWLSQRGKMNGQAKIPRVMNEAQFKSFQSSLLVYGTGRY